MTRHRLTNWALALLIIAIYALMATLDDPSDNSFAAAQAQDLQTAIKTEAEQVRFARASAILCASENAVTKDLGNGVIQCQTRRGTNTRKVVL